MKQALKRILAGALAGGLLFLAACGGGEPLPGAGNAGAPAMGRYVEQEAALPEGPLYGIPYLGYQADGSLLLVAYEFVNEYRINPVAYRSMDGAVSWEGYDLPELAALTADGIGYVYCMTIAPDGTLYAIYEPDDPDEEEYSYIPPRLARVVDGALEDLPVEVGGAEMLTVAGNGDVIAGYYTGESLRVFDAATGREKYTRPTNIRMGNGSFVLVDGNTLAVSNVGALRLYNLDTGERLAEYPTEADPFLPASAAMDGAMTGYKRTALAQDEKDGWFYANSSGLYHLSADGALAEKLLDGGLCSLGTPALDVSVLLREKENDGFLLLGYDGGDDKPVLYRYRYSPDTPTLPSTKISVYSLEDSPTVRQAIGVLGRSHPDIQVEYTVGIDGESSALTAEDAVRNLATRLVAGDIPDVLVLDGLPYESYIGKGILRELDDLLDAGLAESLLPLAYPLGGAGAYAVAGRFTLPMLVALPEAADAFATPQTLAAYMEASGSPQFGVDVNHLIEALYPLYAERWFSGDGSVNESTLREDLEAIRRVAVLQEGYDIRYGEGMLLDGALSGPEVYEVFLGELAMPDDFAAAYTARKMQSGHELYAAPTAEAGLYYPKLLMGITEESANPEAAAAFIACVLGEKVQATTLDDGLPTNRAALESTLAYKRNDPSGERQYTIYGWNQYNPYTGIQDEFIMVYTYWPDDAYFTEIAAFWENAGTPVLANSVTIDILKDSTWDYFAGRQTLDESLATIVAKLNLQVEEAR